jgi:hypothetical protein
VQNESPGKDKEANWLPSPKGPFWVVLRLYVPKPEALEGKWIAPPLNRSVRPVGEQRPSPPSGSRRRPIAG